MRSGSTTNLYDRRFFADASAAALAAASSAMAPERFPMPGQHTTARESVVLWYWVSCCKMALSHNRLNTCDSNTCIDTLSNIKTVLQGADGQAGFALYLDAPVPQSLLLPRSTSEMMLQRRGETGGGDTCVRLRLHESEGNCNKRASFTTAASEASTRSSTTCDSDKPHLCGAVHGWMSCLQCSVRGEL